MPDRAVLTNRYDIRRSSVNSNESTLTPAAVNVFQFGRLFGRKVAGDVYAQPLYVPGVQTAQAGTRNLLVVATASNNLYAFDADDPSIGTPYWQHGTSLFGDPVPASAFGPNYRDFQKTVGITSTPVVDPTTGILYVVAKSVVNGQQRHRVHAFAVGTGTSTVGPVTVACSVKAGADVIEFVPEKQLNRPGLLLVHGKLYVAFGSHGDFSTYHGWVLQYDAQDLSPGAVFCSTLVPDDQADPGSGEPGGGIWQSGSGLASDGRYVYAVSGNGKFGSGSYANCILRLDPLADLQPDAWFHVHDTDGGLIDLDLSTGPVLVTGTPATLVAAGHKEGHCYFVDPTTLDAQQQAALRQDLTATVTFDNSHESNIHGAPVFFGNRMYVWGEYDYLRCYQGDLSAGEPYGFLAASSMHAPPGMPGGFLTVSADGDAEDSAVVWAALPYRGNANTSTVDGILRAFSAADPTVELWNSERNPARDRVGKFAKFCPPIVADGKVVLATFSDPNSSALNEVVVYGPLPGTVAPPADRWLQQDIGTPIVGALTITSSRIIVAGAGADIEGFVDEFHFAYKRIAADTTLVARVRSIDGAAIDPWAKAGVMIRQSLEAWAAHAMMVITPGNGSAFQRRGSVGTALVHTPGPGGTAAQWVRIARSGDTVTGSVSADGTTWTEVGSAPIDLPPTAFVGFAVTAHNGSLGDPLPLVTATFDGVQLG